MRVLCVSPFYWPAFQYGGPVFVTHHLNVALAQKGIDVTVYTTSAGLQDSGVSNVDGVKVTYFPITQQLESVGATGWQFSWALTKALAETIRLFDLVSINAVWNYPSAAAAFFCRAAGIPYVVTPHGALYPYSLSKKRWKKLPYYHLIAKRILKGAAAILYTAEDEADKSHSHAGLRTGHAVIPCVVDLSHFNDAPPKELLKNRYPSLKGRKTILFLSRITWKKGLDLLIAAFALVHQHRKDVHLLIVGHDENEYAKTVKHRIREHGMSYEDLANAPADRQAPCSHNHVSITFTGMLTGQDKVSAYVESDIFVLPSYSENFGVVVVEAMAAGIPVIVSNEVGIHKEVSAFKAGFVIEPDAEQLAHALTQLLSDPELCRAMGGNGRRAVKEKFSSARAADEMIATYKNLIEHGRKQRPSEEP